MEVILGVIAGIFILGVLFLPWINLSTLKSLRQEIEELRIDLGSVQRKLILLEHGAQKTGSVPHRAEVEKILESPEEKTEESLETAGVLTIDTDLDEESVREREVAAIADYEEIFEAPPKKQSSFEVNFGAKLPVWVGSISLILAAFFFVKYSIEAGWLGPVMRVTLGGLFGGGLLAAGQWIGQRAQVTNSVRIAQGLVGAGLVVLYICLYASINLYFILPSVIGFAGMAAVTALAMVLSLRHGQPIAAFALLGGLLTPVMVGSDEPNAVLLFSYLFVLFTGMVVVLARNEWWNLIFAALAGIFLWIMFWCALGVSSADSVVLILFVLAVTAVVLSLTGKRAVLETQETDQDMRPLHGMNIVAIVGGVLTVLYLGHSISFSLLDWGVLGLFTFALTGLTYFRPDIYKAPLALKTGADLALLLVWGHEVPQSEFVAVLAGQAALYIILPGILMRNAQDPRFWSLTQCAAAIALFLISYITLDLPLAWTDSFVRFWGITSLILAGTATYQAWDIRQKFTADQKIQDQLAAIYCFTASFFISAGLAIELPGEYLPLAFAGQIAASAWIYQKTQIRALQHIIKILALVFAFMNYEYVLLFGGMMITSLVGEPLGSTFHYAPDMFLIELGLPALLLGLASWLMIKTDKGDKATVPALINISVVLGLATLYVLFRGSFLGSYEDVFTTQAGFMERALITFGFAWSGVLLLALYSTNPVDILKKWGVRLFRLGMFRLVWFDLLLHNPWHDASQFVGAWPLINGITFVYGLGAIMAFWATGSGKLFAPESKRGKLYQILGGLFLFALVNLTVRQLFHGGSIAVGITEPAEFYSYSAAWLVSGLALLAYGILKQNKPARMASLIVMIATVCKVFLFDASELQDLYRILSFFGLGVCLIGLSFFYTRFVLNDQQKQEEDA